MALPEHTYTITHSSEGIAISYRQNDSLRSSLNPQRSVRFALPPDTPSAPRISVRTPASSPITNGPEPSGQGRVRLGYKDVLKVIGRSLAALGTIACAAVMYVRSIEGLNPVTTRNFQLAAVESAACTCVILGGLWAITPSFRTPLLTMIIFAMFFAIASMPLTNESNNICCDMIKSIFGERFKMFM